MFEVRERTMNGSGKVQGHHLEHYWLCGACSLKFRVEHEKGGAGIHLVPREPVRKPVLPVRPEKTDKPSIVVIAS